MGKTNDQALALLDEMTANNYQWSSERACRPVGVYEIGGFNMLSTKFDAITKRLDQPNMNAVAISSPSCDTGRGGHQTSENLSCIQDAKSNNSISSTTITPSTLVLGKQVENPGRRMEPEEAVIPPTEELTSAPEEVQKEKSYVPPPLYQPSLPFPQRMSSYAKFLKELLSNKRKLEDYETMTLTGERSATL
ncbi:hypothetical protein ACLOJK_022988 [Asimina triloba]